MSLLGACMLGIMLSFSGSCCLAPKVFGEGVLDSPHESNAHISPSQMTC